MWRENQAMKKNLPRKWLLADEILVALAQTQPKNHESLQDSEILSAKQLQRMGEKILAVIETHQNTREQYWPVSGDSHTPEARNLFKRLQKEVKATAQNLGLAPGLLASRKTLQALIDGDPNCSLLSGWRHQELGKTLVELID